MVFASIGPIGKPPLQGELTHKLLQHAFSEQAQALAAESPDAILIETMTDVEEARIASAAALETGLPVVVSFVFLPGGSANPPGKSVTPTQFASALAADGVHGIGANCIDIQESISVCKELAAASSLPIWIKPNAGLPEVTGGMLVYKTSPNDFAAFAPHLRDAGATFLGGCCGTTPEFIRALARQISSQSLAATNLPSQR